MAPMWLRSRVERALMYELIERLPIMTLAKSLLKWLSKAVLNI
jgi:hypothetical protein